jgi:hypothetical protein
MRLFKNWISFIIVLFFFIIRFKPNNPLEFVEKLGFKGRQEDFISIGKVYDRDLNPTIWQGYFLVSVEPFESI